VKPIINQYKRLDIFKCSQEAHREFEGRVSVYHVLKEKGCYPQGCLYFVWHCALLEKGNRCIHGYHHAGKNCKGCTYFVEEKIHLQPELLVEEEAYRRFQHDLEDFENWLESVLFKRVGIGGRIKRVKPWFEKILFCGERHTRLRGYLLVFKGGYIGMNSIQDTFYVRVPERVMQIYGFVPKMKVEMTGEIREDRGRIVVHRPQKIEIIKQGWGRPWTREHALVAVKTATLQEHQSDRCLACTWGALADVVDRREKEERRYRNLYCLKSVVNPENCYVRGLKFIGKDKIQKADTVP